VVTVVTVVRWWQWCGGIGGSGDSASESVSNVVRFRDEISSNPVSERLISSAFKVTESNKASKSSDGETIGTG
jgi:hypothetical protein